jgi:hypothetical protein
MLTAVTDQAPDASHADPVPCGQFALRRTVIECGDDRFTLLGGQSPMQGSRRHRVRDDDGELAAGS